MLVTFANITGVDAIFRQCLCTVRIVRQQAVAVVMKVTDQGHIDTHAVKLLANIRHSLGGFRGVDRDANHLGASQRQLFNLDGRADGIDGVGVGHGLHTHRCITANSHDSRTPHNAGLKRVARLGCCDINGLAGIHYFTSNRATLSLATAERSNAFPRICTCVASARPTMAESGSTPVAPTTSPGARVRRRTTVPFASDT